MSKPFLWWRVSQYGTAECFEETPEIVARINAGANYASLAHLPRPFLV